MNPTLARDGMRYWRLEPDARLHPWIVCYYLVEPDPENPISSPVDTRQLLMPDGHSELVFRLSACFERWRIVAASAAADEAFLLNVLDTDDGARRLGEFGIGGNPRITRHMRNPYFDEKIDGTIHLAIGAGIPGVGGLNRSSVHWDMVKDLRTGGKLYADGELAQESGAWQF